MPMIVVRSRRFLASLVLVLATALFAAVAAQAEIVVEHDAAGRAITFDVQAPGADVAWYASLLSSAPHGNEIGAVTVRIVSPSQVTASCGADAVACYSRGLMIVPVGHDQLTAHALVHEYGHHLDGYWPVAGVRELNGTAGWWTGRGMAALLAQGSVAFDYSRGWDRSVGEIFAEDYAYSVLHDSYEIRWLGTPSAALQSALLAELGGGAATAPPATTPAPPATTRPVVVVRSGALRAGQRRVLPFRLLGPGRHVTFTASVAGSRLAGARVRLEVVCDGGLVASKTLGRGQRSDTLDLANLGPASCEAALASTAAPTLRYAVQLRLALEP